jgi:hypothetical protein
MNALEFTPSPLEKAPALPAGFEELREKIKALTERPLEERFANEPEELARLTSFSDGDLETIKNDGEKPNETDIGNYKRDIIESRRKILFESELMKLLMDSSIFPQENKDALENGVLDKPFVCANEACLAETNLVRGVYRGYGAENLSGDAFRVLQQKTEKGTETDVLLVDAQGHGGGATPLALLTVSFLEAAEKEGVKNPLLALDEFISSLPLNRSEVSLQKIRIENHGEDASKALSITQAGEVYAFWVEGDKEAGWRLKIIAPEKMERNEATEPVSLGNESQLGAIGYGVAGMISGIPSAQTFFLPKDAGIFLSSDGIFDSINPENGKRLVEELPNIIARIFKENTGVERQRVEESLSREIQALSEKYTQTDDETFFKIAA